MYFSKFVQNLYLLRDEELGRDAWGEDVLTADKRSSQGEYVRRVHGERVVVEARRYAAPEEGRSRELHLLRLD